MSEIPRHNPDQSQKEHGELPPVLHNPHDYIVIMPYSANLKTHEPSNTNPNAKVVPAGQPRLSFFSSFAVNAALEMYEDQNLPHDETQPGQKPKFILCGEATFGDGHQTTNDLMREALERHGVPASDIIGMQADHLENTAYQIEAVAKWQRDQNLQDDKFLVLDWQFMTSAFKIILQAIV